METGGVSASSPAITDERVQAALVTALQSREFQSAPQLRAFLGFVVRATLNREQEKLKGYTIAVEALGRSEDFNPVTDPIVRVEAARLRRRLAKYYAGSGADDPVRIVIPKGSYAPEFQPAHASPLPKTPARGVLPFQDTGKTSGPELPDASEPADKGDTAFHDTDSQTGIETPSIPGSSDARLASPLETCPAPAPGRSPSLIGEIARRPVPLAMTILFGGICLLAGYLLALV